MIAILGGGLSGLQLGRRLAERGEDFVVLEGKDAVGGLCRTVTREGVAFDIGPHAFYSKKPEALRYYEELPLDYARLERRVRVCHRDGARVHEVGYPFENGLHELPPAHRLDCVAGYCAASWLGGGPPYAHLRDWIERGLGGGIARRFMLPYNRKIWSCPLEEVSMDLVSQKIEPEPAWSVLRQSLLGGGVGRAYQARFVYPRGGAGELPKAVAKGLGSRVRTGAGVTRLERRSGGGWRARCADGTMIEADAVVSTIPIPELLDALGDPELAPLRAAFRGNDTLFVVVGLKPGRRFARFNACQWVFFAGGEAFYRLTMLHAFGHERPAALVAEITARGGQDHAALVTRALADLREAGILESEDDVAAAFPHLERHTYPIPTLGMPAAREKLEARLAPAGLHLLGRMGRWEYVNTDGVFLGVDAFLAGRGAAVGARR